MLPGPANLTVLVSGSRGCGKSTAVQDTFQGQGVFLAKAGSERTMASVAENILTRFSGEYSLGKRDPIECLGHLLTELKLHNNKNSHNYYRSG